MSILSHSKFIRIMKKFMFAACIAALAFFATSCYRSVVTPLGDDLASFTKKVDQTEYVGVKNTANNVVIIDPVYEIVHYKLGYILAAKNNDFAVFDNTGVRYFENLKINEASAGKDYFIFGTTRGKYFYLPHRELCGPASSFTYYPGLFLLFAQNSDGSYGVYEPDSGDVVLEQKYKSIIYAFTDADQSAFYVSDGKTTKKIVNGLQKPLSNAGLNAMKKEATANKTPWPKDGIGVVKVKTLR